MVEAIPPFRWLLAEREKRRRAWDYWIGDNLLENIIHVTLHYAGRLMTIDMCSGFGATLARFSNRLNLYPEQLQRIRENWALLRPDGSEPDAPHPLRDSISEHIGRNGMEFSVLNRLWKAGRIAVEGEEHLAAARAAGRPIIIVGTHVGNWEVAGPALIALGYPVTDIYQPQGSGLQTALLVKARERYGLKMVPPGRAGALPAYRALLARQSVVAIFVDEFTNDRVHAPFFGRPIKLEGNIVYAARMGMKTGAALIPLYTQRRGGANFTVHFLPPIELVETGNADADLLQNVCRINEVIEPIVRDHLEQWYWLFEFRFDS